MIEVKKLIAEAIEDINQEKITEVKRGIRAILNGISDEQEVIEEAELKIAMYKDSLQKIVIDEVSTTTFGL